MKKISYPLILLFIIMAASCSHNTNYDQLALSGTTMGTTYSIKLVFEEGKGDSVNGSKLKDEIDVILKEVNMQMSTYISDSEISLFNKYEKTDWFKISEDFANVLEMSCYIAEKSGGAFDITVGPLVNLWGFGTGDNYEYVPTEKEIDAALKSVGHKYLHVQTDPPAVKKSVKELYCDLSAIAKGFGVDKVAEFLESKNLNSFMVEIGGEVRTKGLNRNGTDWKIGISTPDEDFNLQRVVSVSGNSIATSGDYRNYFEKDGERFSHSIDPRTGVPIKHKLASVTVIHGSCMMADGMATAITVLGPDAGFELALKEELPVFMIVRENGKFVEKFTPSFEKYLVKENK